MCIRDSGDAAQYVADIELHYFISGTFAGVGHLQADGGRLVRGDDSGGDVEVGVLEGGVAQAVTEGVECSLSLIHILLIGCAVYAAWSLVH